MKFVRLKKRLKWPLLLFAGIGLPVIIIFVAVLGLNAEDSYAQSISPLNILTPQISNRLIDPAQLVTSTEQAVVGLPIRLRIPKIYVNAAIQYVGITPDGAMGTPKLPRDVAWYSLGPRPGEIGSAVFAGHVNWWNGATAVFANLNKLKLGDRIIIQDNKGKIIPFVVRGSKLYGSRDDASTIFNNDDGLAHIALITCDGVWDKKAKEYSKRLVVFADRE